MRTIRLLGCVLGSLLCFCGTLGYADEVAVVFLKTVHGNVLVRSLGEPDWHAPGAGMPLEETTEVKLSAGAAVLIWLDHEEAAGKVAMMDQGVFRFALIRREDGERKTVIEVGHGTLTVQGDGRRKTSGLEIRTPTGRMAVKDAAMRIRVE